jgi:hypothetical protein
MDTNKTTAFQTYTPQGYKPDTSPYVFVFETRDPQSSDTLYPLQKPWLNLSNNKLFILTSFTSQAGYIQAVWTNVSSALSDVNTLTGDDANPVTAVNYNINIVSAASGAIEFTNGGAGVLNAAVKVDGATISVNGSNQLTVNNTGINWLAINTNQQLQDSTGYILQAPGGTLTLQLPSISNLGDTVEIVLDGATSFTILQQNGQQINYLNNATTLGATGQVSSTIQGNYVRMVCTVANTTWRILQATGSITLV